MPKESSLARLVPLGGLGEVGMNCLVVEQGEDRVLIDCGIMFPAGEAALGVEVIAPDLSWLRSGPPPHAVLLTHAHEDHLGALPYLLREFPETALVGARFTLAVAKAKLAEHGISPRALVEVAPHGSGTAGSIAFEPLQVPHSVPDSLGYVLRTNAGLVIHTGDFKVDWSPVDGRLLDVRRFSELGDEGVTCLLSDSTNAEREGTSTSEREVAESLARIFGGPLAKNRIVVALFSSNIHRVQSVLRAGLAQGRKFCLLGRSVQQNVRLALDLGLLKCPPDAFIDPESADHFAPKELVILCTGAQGEPRSALARLAAGEHASVHIDKGDLVILSSRAIPGNERMLSALIDVLVRRGCRVLGGVSGGSELVHATGHACQGEQRMMLDLVRPRSFVPIHGEYRMLAAHARTAEAAGVRRALVVEDGDIVELREGEVAAHSPERAKVGRIYLDTRLSVGTAEPTLRDRQLLADAGVLVCLVGFDKHGQVVRGPEVFGRGVSGVEDGRLKQAAGAAAEMLKTLSPSQIADRPALEESLRRAVRSAWRKNVEKRPMVLPVILDL